MNKIANLPQPLSGGQRPLAPYEYRKKTSLTKPPPATHRENMTDTLVRAFQWLGGPNNPVILMKIKGLGLLECDFVAQAFQLAHRSAGDGCFVPLLKILASQVHKGPPGLDDVMENYGDAVGHRHRRPLGPNAPGEAPVLGSQVGLGPSGGLGRLHQSLPS